MIVSQRHGFIFVKTPKTAGTSIEVFLSKHCGPEDIVTPFGREEPGHQPRNHRGFFNPIPELSPAVSSKLPVPPPKRILRQFIARRRIYNHIPAWHARHRLGRETWNNAFKFCFERNPWDKTLSFFHMLQKRGVIRDLDHLIKEERFPIGRHFYTDLDGSIIVDKIYRYEDLLQDMAEICTRFGIPFEGELGINAKAGFRKDKTHYRDVLTTR